MSVFDVVIAGASIFAVCIVFFLPRNMIFGPLILGWAGAAVGVAFSMMRHYDRLNDRVNLADSLPLMGVGLLCGLVPGALFARIYRFVPASRGWIEVLDVTILFAGVGMLGGTWLGIKSPSRPLETYSGIVLGGLVGLAIGLVQWWAEGRKKDPAKKKLPRESPILDE